MSELMKKLLDRLSEELAETNQEIIKSRSKKLDKRREEILLKQEILFDLRVFSTLTDEEIEEFWTPDIIGNIWGCPVQLIRDARRMNPDLCSVNTSQILEDIFRGKNPQVTLKIQKINVDENGVETMDLF